MVVRSLQDSQGADLATLREHNSRRVLDALLTEPDGLTQVRIASITDLSRSTVSKLLADLSGVLIQEEPCGLERGRPARRWRIDPQAAYSIGIEIGQAHVSVAIADPFGDLLSETASEPVKDVFQLPHAVLSRGAAMLERVIEDAKIDCQDIAAITIGLPGPVDIATGAMADDAAHTWAGIDVREEVRKRWPHSSVPAVLADNGANLAALAEHRFGVAVGVESLMFLKWSTGIGCGLILGNRLWRGRSGVAGELGHLPVEPTAEQARALALAPIGHRRRCARCNHANCLERSAGGRTVAAAVGVKSLDAAIRAALDPSSARHKAARAALSAAASLIGTALGPAITLLNVERMIIGGLVGRELYPMLIEDFHDAISETAFSPAQIDVSLAMGSLGRDAAVRGAAVLGFEIHGPDFLLGRARSRPRNTSPTQAAREKSSRPIGRGHAVSA